MTWNSAEMLLNVIAMSPPSGGDGTAAPGWWNMLPLFLLIFAFYFAILRPQQKRQKQHDILVKTVKTGDKVTTSSGIMGTVVSVKERSVNVRSVDSKIELLKTAISEITERGANGDKPQS